MITVEFYNKVHKKSDGKFAQTAGPSHAKGAPDQSSPAAKAKATALKKTIAAKPKTSAGSVVVSGDKLTKYSKATTAQIKATVAKHVAAKKAAGSSSSSDKKSAPEVKKPASVVKKAAAAVKKPAPESPALSKLVAKTKIDPKIAASYQNPLLHKPVEKLTTKEQNEMFNALYGSKGAGSLYEYHPGQDDGSKHGYLIDGGGTEKYVALKAGMTIAEAASLLIKKVGAEPAAPKEAPVKGTSEEKRIANLLKNVPSRIIAHNTVSDLDEIGGGTAMGMNATPPPSGIKASKLTDDHIIALAEYRGSGYKQINDALRKDTKQSAGTKSVIDNLDAAFKSAAKSTKEITVYRGIGGKFAPGKGFTDKGFTSTTYNQGDSTSFGDKTIRIVISKGTPLLKVSGDSSQGFYSGEAELLLPRGMTYVRQSDGSYRV